MAEKEENEVDTVAAEQFKQRIEIQTAETANEMKLHLLPCHALQSGPAEVAKFFQPVPIEVQLCLFCVVFFPFRFFI